MKVSEPETASTVYPNGCPAPPPPTLKVYVPEGMVMGTRVWK